MRRDERVRGIFRCILFLGYYNLISVPKHQSQHLLHQFLKKIQGRNRYSGFRIPGQKKKPVNGDERELAPSASPGPTSSRHMCYHKKRGVAIVVSGRGGGLGSYYYHCCSYG